MLTSLTPFVLACVLSQPAAPEVESDATIATVEAFLKTWADEWRTGRVERMLALYDDSPNVLAVESRGILRKGLAGIRRMYEEAFDGLTFEKVELTPEVLSASGDTAWATCRYKATVRQQASGTRYILEVRGSFVLTRFASARPWRIALEHFSTLQDVPRVREADAALAPPVVVPGASLVVTSNFDAPAQRESGANSPDGATAAAAPPRVGSDVPASPPVGTDWPRWRGPRGDGTWHGPPLPEIWPEAGLNTLWKQPVGGGYAGVIVADGRVFLADRQTEPEEVERLLCLDADDGDRLWSVGYEVAYGDLDYGNGPRTAPTVADDRVYLLGALGHLHCLDITDGSRLWSTHLVREHNGRQPTWGYAASPLVLDDLLIVQPGAADGTVVALDRRTGAPVWRSLGDEAGYATPILIEHAGARQLIIWTPQHVASLEPATGRLNWRVPYKVTMGVSIATPVYHDTIVFVSGFWEGSKAIELGRAPGAARLLWEENRHLRGLMSQPLVRDGHAYLLDKAYGLTCFELRTGTKLWDDGNRATPRGRNPQASLVALGESNRVLILNSDGELILARITPAGYHEQSRTKIIGETWAHPAYAGRRVYARSDSELVCVELPARHPEPERPRGQRPRE